MNNSSPTFDARPIHHENGITAQIKVKKRPTVAGRPEE